MSRKLTPAQRIEQFRGVHGDQYDYVPDTIKSAHVKMTVICPDHGEFQQTVANHMKGQKCPGCVGRLRVTNEMIDERLEGRGITRLGDIENTKVPILWRCEGCSHEWMANFNNVQTGHGCPACAAVAVTESRRFSGAQWLERFLEAHGDRYDYGDISVENRRGKVKITCSEHGEFQQAVEEHAAGSGCPECAISRNADSRRHTPEQWLEKFREVHGDRYEYDLSGLSGNRSKITIKCPEHGEFEQTAFDHHQGCGCSACKCNRSSAQEDALADLVAELIHPDEIVRNDRGVLGGKELDIYIPSRGIAIEYCGVYWHSEKFKGRNEHRDKMLACEALGIRLITIFEDEWVFTPEVVKRTLVALLGARERGLPARKLAVQVLDRRVARGFLDEHHIQGATSATIHYGAFDGPELVAVMSFGKPTRQSAHRYELRRFCTGGKTHAGAAGKLLKGFMRVHPDGDIVSFSDSRWFSGAMYPAIGFEDDGEVRPDYTYAKGQRRHHKSGFRRKGIQSRLPDFYAPEMSEGQMMDTAGYLRIYDCGKRRWILRR